ncbi:MAG: hypothetical protein ACU0C8_11475, partial [Roseovarius sp.]
QREAGVAEYRTEVGDKFNTHIAAGNKAMRLLELTGEDIAGIEQGLGTKKTLALFAKLGMGMGEDILLDAMFDLPSLENVEEVVVNEEAVTSEASPLIIYAEAKGKKGGASAG